MNTFNLKESIKALSIPYHLNVGEKTEILKNNLRLLDCALPIIWEEALKIVELHPNRTLNQLAESLIEINPVVMTVPFNLLYMQIA